MLAETPEAQDLIALLDVLVSTGHDLSLARALRSPLFGADATTTCSRIRAARPPTARAGGARCASSRRRAPALARARDRCSGAGTRWSRRCRRTTCSIASSSRATCTRATPPRCRPSSAPSRSTRSTPCSPSRSLSTAAATRRPTRFVRALKQRAVKAALPVRASTVRLLTVHGAKGLEADTVFVMDTEPERHEPADDDAAGRVAGRCRAADALRLRLQREPLPAVAARRARRRGAGARARGAERALRRDVARQAAPRLQRHRAVSATDRADVVEPRRRRRARPRRSARPSCSFASPVLAAAASDEATIVIATLPPWRASSTEARASAGAAPAASARIGRAVHRALEWIVADRGDRSRRSRRRRGARVRRAPPRPFAHGVAAIVEHPECARFLRGPQIRWSGNEVTVSDGGEVLRIDRLASDRRRPTARSGGCSTTS